jgi:hypothetical protein
MTIRLPYTYSVLRYRHDSVAGELVNVGVLLHEPASKFLGIRVRDTLGRLTKLYSDLDASSFKDALRSVKNAAEFIRRTEADDLFTLCEDVRYFANRMFKDGDGCLVWGEIGSGITLNAALTLDKLFQRFVSQHDDILSR